MDITAPGRELHARFNALGDMSGKSMHEITRFVGPANSMSQTSSGVLLQWIVTGYHIALQFDEQGNFVQINHQFLNYEPDRSRAWGFVALIGIAAIIAFLTIVSRN